MKISYSHETGRIYDFFFSFWMYDNSSLLKERREANGLPLESQFEKHLLAEYDESLPPKGQMSHYTNVAAEPSYILPPDDLFRFHSIDAFLDAIEGMDEDKILYHVKRIMDQYANGESEAVEDSSQATLLQRLETLPIPPEAKWELYLLITNKQSYLKSMVAVYRSHRELFDRLIDERENHLADFERGLMRMIEQAPDEFVSSFQRIYDLSSYDNVYVTSSALITLQMSVDTENNAYIILGPNIETVMWAKDNAEDLKEALVQIRNVCENSKFLILKYLAKEEHFGQEIAEELDLTKPTVSHHLNYLTSQNWVTMRQSGVRMYYKLNSQKVAQDMEKALKLILKELE